NRASSCSAAQRSRAASPAPTGGSSQPGVKARPVLPAARTVAAGLGLVLAASSALKLTTGLAAPPAPGALAPAAAPVASPVSALITRPHPSFRLRRQSPACYMISSCA